jgi:hypothetical protein
MGALSPLCALPFLRVTFFDVGTLGSTWAPGFCDGCQFSGKEQIGVQSAVGVDDIAGPRANLGVIGLGFDQREPFDRSEVTVAAGRGDPKVVLIPRGGSPRCIK